MTMVTHSATFSNTRSRLACSWLRGEIIRVIEAGGTVTVEVRRAS